MNKSEKKNDGNDIDLETLFNFFKNLNDNTGMQDDDANFSNIDTSDDDEILNSYITESEILKCLKLLKNNKCSANDSILNEYLKYSSGKMLPIYVLFFNLILETGLIPEPWLEGIIRPIYKRSGDSTLPENYRPISILSCFGKLFTAILNHRLTEFLNYNNILEENQAGFRAGYSTTDHIFTLHALTEILKTKKKKLFCLFVDYSKAFDSVWRTGLWMKLLSNGINGKIFRIIFNMYQNIKSCVFHSGQQSDFFYSRCGVRQGENLSPVLFSLFLNDLDDYLLNSNCSSINLNLPENNIDSYLKLLTILYADDTVIFGTDPESFQENISVFYEYSKLWKLNVNFDKTKILIFGVRNTQHYNFRLGDNDIDICDEFKYLGTVFTKQRSFYKAIKHNIEHARKALHLLYKQIRNLNIPLDLQLHLFDSTVLPIILYGCEVWGFQSTKMIDTLYNQFLRNVTKLRKSTPIYMLYAELGRRPIDIYIKSRMISFWISLVNDENRNKISKRIYEIMRAEYDKGQNYKWLDYIKNILISVGQPDLFNQVLIENPRATKTKNTNKLHDLYIQEWQAKLQLSSKGRNYSIFKETTNIEPYLLNTTSNIYIPIIKFRTCNFKLPIEVVGKICQLMIENVLCVTCMTSGMIFIIS